MPKIITESVRQVSGIGYRELVHKIEQVLGDCPTHYCPVFLLSITKGYGPKVIAEMTGLNEQSVRNALYRSRLLLRGALTK